MAIELTTLELRFELGIRKHRAKLGTSQEKTFRVGVLAISGVNILLGVWLFYRWWWQPIWLDFVPSSMLETINLVEDAGIISLLLVWLIVGWGVYRNKNRHPQVITLEELHTLSPGAFERYVAGLFRKKGWQVKIRGRSGDLGVDLELIDMEGNRAIVQCKRYRKTVGAEVVRELYGALVHEHAVEGYLVTTAGISPAARDWAYGKPLSLIDGQSLLKMAASLR